MLVLFETPAGFALFKCLKDGKMTDADDIFEAFSSPEKANETYEHKDISNLLVSKYWFSDRLKLKAFQKFTNTADALSAATAIVEGKMNSGLKSFLKSELDEKSRLNEILAVGDAKLGSAIAKKMGIKVVSDSVTNELMRGIRSQLSNLISGILKCGVDIIIF